MKILKFDTASLAAECLANELYKQLKAKPDSVLGVATGRTMDAVYHSLFKMHQKDKLDCSQARAFALDEYIGLSPDHKASFEYYLNFHLFEPLGFDKSNTNIPNVYAEDFGKAGAEYENAISKAGGLDVVILGIGVNGHIALNEPGSAYDSKTRIVALSSQTISSNKSLFPDGKIPNTAITMGIGTILKAKKCYLIATGVTKAEVIANLIKADINSDLPASFLKDHPDFTLILDNDSSKLVE
jgi:glucosamine-6-phosphate deaminase